MPSMPTCRHTALPHIREKSWRGISADDGTPPQLVVVNIPHLSQIFFTRYCVAEILQVYFATKFGFADEFSRNVYDRALEEFSNKHKGWDKKFNVKEVRTEFAVNFILVLYKLGCYLRLILGARKIVFLIRIWVSRFFLTNHTILQ